MTKSSKGSAYEREICTTLSLWWTEGENDAIFWRTSQSGGRSTLRGRKGKQAEFHCGDIAAANPSGQPLLDLITWELKRGYNRSTIQDLIDKPKKAAKQVYEQWIEQAENSKNLAKSFSWAILVRRDRREPLILLPARLDNLFKHPLWLSSQHPSFCLSRNENGSGILVLSPLEAFLNRVSPEEIIQLSEAHKHGNLTR